MPGPRLLVTLRHGLYERNERIDAVGEKAREVANIRRKESDDYKLGLLPKGEGQVKIARPKLRLAVGALDICVSSPLKRAYQSADIMLEGTDTPIVKDPNLRERELGIFNDIPREIFHTEYADSYAEKLRDPLNWRPIGGKTLIETGRRAIQAYFRDDVEDKIVLFSTHADVMISLRARRELTNLSTPAKLKRPLSPDLQNPQWIQNVQFDMFTDEDPTTSKKRKDVTYFRSVTSADTEYDTGWLKIQR